MTKVLAVTQTLPISPFAAMHSTLQNQLHDCDCDCDCDCDDGNIDDY